MAAPETGSQEIPPANPIGPADHLMGVYNRAPLAFERGRGVRLYTAEGAEYLDCMAGIAVNALGHAHPVLVKALEAQGEKLWHVSNIFRIPDQEALAERLCEISFADVCFFTNSGTEAIECALKTARKFHSADGHPERIDVIAFEGAFHGRSYAAVNAAGNPSYVAGFGPPLPGYVHLAWADWEALEAAAAQPTAAAILVEPVQGEGGARALSTEDLRRLRSICDRHGLLLIYDEIQCGLGRTGKLFAYEWAGEDYAPDIMALAKALGGGFPVGACLATAKAAKGMTVGAHGSTYGGNPLAMAVARAAIGEIATAAMMEHVRNVAGYLTQQLEGLMSRNPDVIEEIRGKGLLVGLKLRPSNRAFMQWARDERLLIAGGGDNCVRLLPPLIISREEISEAVEKLERACARARAEGSKAEVQGAAA
jgi:acetylornithine/N-succinyldiaminopimelate aminotransferase